MTPLAAALSSFLQASLNWRAHFLNSAVQSGLEAFQLGLNALLDGAVMQTAFGDLA